jgi:hypothetical protein
MNFANKDNQCLYKQVRRILRLDNPVLETLKNNLGFALLVSNYVESICIPENGQYAPFRHTMSSDTTQPDK